MVVRNKNKDDTGEQPTEKTNDKRTTYATRGPTGIPETRNMLRTAVSRAIASIRIYNPLFRKGDAPKESFSLAISQPLYIPMMS